MFAPQIPATNRDPSSASSAVCPANAEPSAKQTYESAAQARPKDPAPLLALAGLARDKSDAAGAMRYLEQALPLIPAQDREHTLRLLLATALDLKDFDSAKRFHRELAKQSQNSLLVKGELGRELEARGEYERAEAEFRSRRRCAISVACSRDSARTPRRSRR